MMVSLKYQAKPFGLMEYEERMINSCGLLVKISAITGWIIPNEKVIFDALADQLTKKLSEGYPTLNAEEIEYAFRSNLGVSDWGKEINLSLINEVLYPYMQKRKELSMVEEQKKSSLEYKSTEDTSDVAMAAWFEDVSFNVTHNKTSVDFMPVMLYDWLDKNGRIKVSNKVKNEYIDRAASKRIAQLADQACNSEHDKNKFISFVKMVDEGCVSGEENIKRLQDTAKKLLLFDLINSGAF